MNTTEYIPSDKNMGVNLNNTDKEVIQPVALKKRNGLERIFKKKRAKYLLLAFILGLGLMLVDLYRPYWLKNFIIFCGAGEHILHFLSHSLIHIWPEIIVTSLFIFFIELGIDEILGHQAVFLTPIGIVEELGKVEYKKDKTIRILDTSVNNYIVPGYDSRNQDPDVPIKDRPFAKELISFMKSGGSVELLLLHPDTPAARQRHEDLKTRNSGKNFLQEMRNGLRMIHMLHEHLKEENLEGHLIVKFFRSTPTISLYIFGEKMFYKPLPPFEASGHDNNNWLEVKKDAALFDFNIFSFNRLLHEKNKELVVGFDEYYYIIMDPQDQEQPKTHKMYWGGDDFNPVGPRYLMPFSEDITEWTRIKDHYFPKNKPTKKFHVDVVHNSVGEQKAQVIRKIDHDTNQGSEWRAAFSKICRIYGWSEKAYTKQKYKKSIYELRYEKEMFEIRAEPNEVKEKVNDKNVNFAFLSHRQMDINLNKRLNLNWTLLNHVFDHLPNDETDQAYCDKLNTSASISSDPKINERSYVAKKRMMAICTATYKSEEHRWDFELLEQRLPELIYPGEFTPYYDGLNENKNELDNVGRITEKKIKSWHYLYKKGTDIPLFDLRISQERQNLRYFKKFLESVVEFDFSLVDADKNKFWTIFVQLIRSDLTKKNDRSVIFWEKKAKTGMEYQFVHLIQRKHVSGGITTVQNKSQKRPTEYPLEFSCDTFITSPERLGKNSILQEGVPFKVSDVLFEENKDNKPGIRDVLVIDMKIG
jgi:hypothetical protein